MQLSKREARTLAKMIAHWRAAETLPPEALDKLECSYEVVGFDWARMAKYSFWLAIVCVLIAIITALADEWIMDFFKKLFDLSDVAKTAVFALLASGFYYIGVWRKQKQPSKIYSNEAIFFLGVMFTGIAIAFLGSALDTGSGHFSMLLLLAALIYAGLGLWFPSKLVWLFALLSLGSWLGAETGYLSGWGAYYLGMNYPLRFVLFGLVLVLAGGYAFQHWPARNDFLRPTRAVGLLYLFIALWLMSIFGNYGDISSWRDVKQIELFHWSLIFGLAALAAIVHGVKYDDAMTRGFGLTFIFINLYTRFFEYFWEGTHKAVFFALLAASFWYLGSRAEKIWQVSLIRSVAEPKKEGNGEVER